jgi:hypothetical protein
MFGRRTAIGVGYCVLALVLAPACGGSVSRGNDDDPTDGGSSPTAGKGGRSFGGGSAGRAGSAGAGGSSATAGRGGKDDPPPVMTGCPDGDLPPPDITCDPYVIDSCGPGFGCYPNVDHPEGSGCDAQVYGTQCVPVGGGTQGSLCGEGTDFCAAGFVCVVGQRAGKRCAQLCKLGESNQCAGGLLCSDLDVAGFGVCG